MCKIAKLYQSSKVRHVCSVITTDQFPYSLFPFMPALCKELLDIQATIESGFTLKRICDMTRKYSQMEK